MCVSETEKKKYTFAISAVKTYLYRIEVCFKITLSLIDRLAYVISVLNYVGNLYCIGKICDLGKQANYRCLTGIEKLNGEHTENIDTNLIRQRTELWHEIRAGARVTGSTCFEALGLAGEKKQKQHMDSVFNSKAKPDPTPEVQTLMKHGSDNEINAVATLVSKVLSVFLPKAIFLEEGCHREFKEDQLLLLVSPDGLIKECDHNEPEQTTSQTAVEIKCPYPPQNVFKPAVYYNIPYYYVTQILCEMVVLGRTALIFICYSQETTVVIEAEFDSKLWEDIWCNIIHMYDRSAFTRNVPANPPTDKKDLEARLKEYSKTKTHFLAKVPSIVAKECFEGGLYVPVTSFDGQWFKLAVRSASGDPLTLLQLMKDVFLKAKAAKKADIVRLIKETNVVQVVSQAEVLSVCKVEANITEDGHIYGPINIYRASQCQILFHTTTSLLEVLRKKTRKGKRDMQQEKSDTNNSGTDTFNLLDEIPTGVIQDMDDHAVEALNRSVIALGTGTVGSSQSEVEVDDISELFTEESTSGSNDLSQEGMMEETHTQTANDEKVMQSGEEVENAVATEQTGKFGETELNKMLTALQSTKRQKRKSQDIGIFMRNLENTNTINENLFKSEMLVCLNAVSEFIDGRQIKFGTSWRKEKIVDFLYKVVTDSPTIPFKERKPRRRLHSLKHLCSVEFARFPKDALNVIYAEYLHPMEEKMWRQNMSFSTPTFIEGLNVFIDWYSKPEYVEKRYTYLFSMLDCHHLFTNARITCCSRGIRPAGIMKEAWSKVARENATNGTGLSQALVEDLVDRQSNAYAQKTFSASVEEAMRENGDINEAHFCKLIREWYQAEDDPGLSSNERCRRRLKFRDWLIGQLDIGKFPPPGFHINGIPVVLFEGIMTNIERRNQIFQYVKKGKYNVRACGSLENENFFGEFQDLDPKGSGVSDQLTSLRPSALHANSLGQD